jgi:biopolymer transport protein ExbB
MGYENQDETRPAKDVSPMSETMTIGELLLQGGWPMAPIYLCSIVALAIFSRKLLQFRAERLFQTAWLEPILTSVRSARFDEALERTSSIKHPAARVIETMLATLRTRPDRVEAEARRVGSLEVQRLEKQIGALSFIAQAAPLLGLLGTVIGMVELFMSLQSAGLTNVDAALLASGIWKALLTTAAGLVVAVPTLAAYSYLHSRTDAFRLTLRDAIERVLTALPEPDPTDGRTDRPRPQLVREVASGV